MSQVLEFSGADKSKIRRIKKDYHPLALKIGEAKLFDVFFVKALELKIEDRLANDREFVGEIFFGHGVGIRN